MRPTPHGWKKRSKCDQFCRYMLEPPEPPVAAMSGYLVQRGNAPGPLFVFKDGRFLTRDRFVTAVRSALEKCGIDLSAYAGYSFRVGAATTAAARDLQDSLIKTLGRWDSSAYTVYNRAQRSTLVSVARSLVSGIFGTKHMSLFFPCIGISCH